MSENNPAVGSKWQIGDAVFTVESVLKRGRGYQVKTRSPYSGELGKFRLRDFRKQAKPYDAAS